MKFSLKKIIFRIVWFVVLFFGTAIINSFVFYRLNSFSGYFVTMIVLRLLCFFILVFLLKIRKPVNLFTITIALILLHVPIEISEFTYYLVVQLLGIITLFTPFYIEGFSRNRLRFFSSRIFVFILLQLFLILLDYGVYVGHVSMLQLCWCRLFCLVILIDALIHLIYSNKKMQKAKKL